MPLIFSFTWWMVGFIVAQRNKPVVIWSAPGKPPWQQPKIIAMVPEKILLRISERIHLWGREQAWKNAAPKVSILQCSWHMKIGGCDGNCGAILVTMGAANTSVHLPHGAINYFPCHIMDWDLLPLKAEFCRSTMKTLLSAKIWSWSWAFSALSGQMFALGVWKITFHISCAMISVGDSKLQDSLCTHTLYWKLCALPFITLFLCTFCRVPCSVNLRSCL